MVRFSIAISNQGEMDRAVDTAVLASINDGDAIEVATVPPLAAGETTTLVFEQRLEPGQQQVNLQVDNSKSLATVDILVSDIVVAPVYYEAIADGEVEVGVRLTNEGTLASRPIQLLASNDVVATVQAIEPGASRDVNFVLELARGMHAIEVTAAADEREVMIRNNTMVIGLSVEYVSFDLQALSTEILGFARGDVANVTIDFIVVNAGVADSGEFIVSIACPDSSEGTCSGQTVIDQLGSGERFEGTIDAVVPQGTGTVTLFAGELDDGYLWGETNTISLTLDVPVRAAVELEFDAVAELIGYYSNGDALISLAASLANLGAESMPGQYSVNVSCFADAEVISNCGDVINFDLTDGFGPTYGITELRVPQGAVNLHMDSDNVPGTDEHVDAQLTVTVPERIVGIDREVWNCFRDTSYSDEFPKGSCSGRERDVVHKWPSDAPVTIWINGKSTYDEEFEKVLEAVASEINFEYQLLPDIDGASIIAYVGITEEDARELELDECEEPWGCARYQTDEEGNVVSAELIVFEVDSTSLEQLRLTDEMIDYALMQQITRVALPIGTRNAADSVLSVDKSLRFPRLSDSDRQIAHIISSPLVQSGNTTEDIADLIVFSDELLDPAEPEPLTPRQIIEQAHLKLHQSGGTLFTMQGEWRGDTCIDSFGPSQVTIASYSAHRGIRYRLSDASSRFYVLLRSQDGRAEYWNGAGQTWRRFFASDEQDLIQDTAWNPQYSDPLTMLASVLWFGPDEIIDFKETDEGIEFNIRNLRAYATPTWAEDARVVPSFTVNPDTYEITRFSMTWHFTVTGLQCDEYVVDAVLIEYGSGFFIPNEVRAASNVVD